MTLAQGIKWQKAPISIAKKQLSNSKPNVNAAGKAALLPVKEQTYLYPVLFICTGPEGNNRERMPNTDKICGETAQKPEKLSPLSDCQRNT